MKGFRLNDRTAESICHATGMSVEEIAGADVSAVDDAIQRKIDRELTPAVDLGGVLPRGSVYLMFDRFLTKTDINKGISAIRP